jgi:hypothetical protein
MELSETFRKAKKGISKAYHGDVDQAMTIASPQFRIVFICCLDGVQVCL